MSLGTFILITTEDDQLSVAPDQINEIRAAYRAWIERGVTSVLELVQTNGDEFVLSADQILTYLVSTPDGRRRRAEEGVAAKSETMEIRTALGLPWEDE
jgi:hypothetical protein